MSMFSQPWSYKEGTVIGAGLFLTGALLQSVLGPVEWDIFAWPVNIAAAVLYVALLVIGHLLRGRSYLLRWMSSIPASVSSMAWAAGITVVMGLIRQIPSSAPYQGFPGFSQMVASWPFTLLYFWMLSCLGLTVLRVCIPFNIKRLPFALTHLGLFVALLCGVMGSADLQRYRMTAFKGRPECRAFDSKGFLHELPLTLELKSFTIDEYPPERSELDDSVVTMPAEPRSYISVVDVFTESGKAFRDTIMVNSPCRVEGWKIYQFGYDTSRGKMSDFSVFEVVRDPWLVPVYAGIWMLIAGAVLVLWLAAFARRSKRVPACIFSCLGLALVFVCARLLKPEILSDTPMPALQSPWFAPHVTVYMFAYALFGAAFLVAVYLLCTRKVGSAAGGMLLCDDLVGVGLAFMTVGMLFGAVWAEQAWGHYWSWDPKETWAAATWLSFLCYVHLRRGGAGAVRQESDSSAGGGCAAHLSPRDRAALYVILISFVFLQLCWWGINYLPSARGASIHTYNF